MKINWKTISSNFVRLLMKFYENLAKNKLKIHWCQSSRLTYASISPDRPFLGLESIFQPQLAVFAILFVFSLFRWLKKWPWAHWIDQQTSLVLRKWIYENSVIYTQTKPYAMCYNKKKKIQHWILYKMGKTMKFYLYMSRYIYITYICDMLYTWTNFYI